MALPGRVQRLELIDLKAEKGTGQSTARLPTASPAAH
jgi:hypothetical protein